MSQDTRERLNKNFEAKRLPLLKIKCNSTRCWLHPAPNAKGRVHVSLCWRETSAFGTPEPQFEFGTVSKLLAGSMTPTEREGWVNDSHHLSHLCGNASCCNPAHHVIESANKNGSRKTCHNRRRGGPNAAYVVCEHDPPCLYRTEDGAVYVPKSVMGEVRDAKRLRQATLSFGATKSEKVAGSSKLTMVFDSPLEDVAKAVQDATCSLENPFKQQEGLKAEVNFRHPRQVRGRIRKMITTSELHHVHRELLRDEGMSWCDKYKIQESIKKRIKALRSLSRETSRL